MLGRYSINEQHLQARVIVLKAKGPKLIPLEDPCLHWVPGTGCHHPRACLIWRDMGLCVCFTGPVEA